MTPAHTRAVDVDRLRALEAAATPAPWVHDPNRAVYVRDELHTCVRAPHDEDDTVVALTGVQGRTARGAANADLIAAIRNALPTLLDAPARVAELETRAAQAVDRALELARERRQLQADLDQLAADFETTHPDGKIAVNLAVDHCGATDAWAGHVTVYGFATHQTAHDVGQVLAAALAEHTGLAVHAGTVRTQHAPLTQPPTPVERVLRDVAAERTRQDQRWGQQDYPDGTGPYTVLALAGMATDVAGRARAYAQHAAAKDRLTWRDLTVMEIAGAFAERDPNRLRAALVQAAAVLACWVEAIDRRAARPAQAVRLGPDTGYVRFTPPLSCASLICDNDATGLVASGTTLCDRCARITVRQPAGTDVPDTSTPTRADLIEQATRKHDEACNCDRRYRMSCHRMAAAILALAAPPAGDDQVAGAPAARTAVADLLDLAQQVLARFNHPGHPGRPCLSTGWVNVTTVQAWRDRLRAIAQDLAVPADVLNPTDGVAP